MIRYMTTGRTEREKTVIEMMIRMYCRGNRHNGSICVECAELIAYSHARLEAYRFKDSKPFCSKCPVTATGAMCGKGRAR